MRDIGSRQFQQHFHEEIKNLPFVVSAKGKPLFLVSQPPPESTTQLSLETSSPLFAIQIIRDIDSRLKAIEQYLGK